MELQITSGFELEQVEIERLKRYLSKFGSDYIEWEIQTGNEGTALVINETAIDYMLMDLIDIVTRERKVI